MFKLFRKRRVIKFKHHLGSQIDCHKWASKMETHRLVSSKSLVKPAQPAASSVVD